MSSMQGKALSARISFQPMAARRFLKEKHSVHATLRSRLDDLASTIIYRLYGVRQKRRRLMAMFAWMADLQLVLRQQLNRCNPLSGAICCNWHRRGRKRWMSGPNSLYVGRRCYRWLDSTGKSQWRLQPIYSAVMVETIGSGGDGGNVIGRLVGYSANPADKPPTLYSRRSALLSNLLLNCHFWRPLLIFRSLLSR